MVLSQVSNVGFWQVELGKHYHIFMEACGVLMKSVKVHVIEGVTVNRSEYDKMP